MGRLAMESFSSIDMSGAHCQYLRYGRGTMGGFCPFVPSMSIVPTPVPKVNGKFKSLLGFFCGMITGYHLPRDWLGPLGTINGRAHNCPGSRSQGV